MRILVVEDEPVLARGLRAGLAADGFAVDVALTGVDGLWLAREEPFDAIVLDLMLPGVSGSECAARCGPSGFGRRSSCSPRGTASGTRSTGWTPARTTT